MKFNVALGSIITPIINNIDIPNNKTNGKNINIINPKTAIKEINKIPKIRL